MTIKPNKATFILIPGLLLPVYFATAFLLISLREMKATLKESGAAQISHFDAYLPVVVAFIFLIAICAFVISGAISSFKVIRLSESGCTINFCGISKTYRWSELKTIKIGNFGSDRDQNAPGYEWIKISKYEDTKNRSPENPYDTLFHPFASTHIAFNSKPSPKTVLYSRIDIYMAGKEELLRLLSEWGVHYQDAR